MATKKYLDQEGLTELVSKIRDLINEIGHVTFKGSVEEVTDLPSLATVTDGWMYMIKTAGVTTAEFIEGADVPFKANTEVVKITTLVDDTEVARWCLMGTIFDVDDRLQFGIQMPTSPSDGQTFLYTGNTSYTNYGGTLTKDSNPSALGLYELNQSSEYVLTSDTEPQTVYKSWSDGSLTYFTKSATPQVDDTVYTITSGEVEDSGYQVTSYSVEDGITVNGNDYARDSSSDEYIDEKSYYVEQYLQGVIYQYDSSESKWVALSQGDEFTPIPNAYIDSLFV